MKENKMHQFWSGLVAAWTNTMLLGEVHTHTYTHMQTDTFANMHAYHMSCIYTSGSAAAKQIECGSCTLFLRAQLCCFF